MIGRLRLVGFGHIVSRTSFTLFQEELEFAQGGILDDTELLLNLPVGDGTGGDGEFQDGLLAFVEFLQHLPMMSA